MKKRLLISFSGGRTSAFMLWWLLNCWEDRSNWEIVVVFANTGLEASETLLFVHQCAINWGIEVIWVEGYPKESKRLKWWGVECKIVNYFTAARAQKRVDGTWEWTPFEAMISKLGIPTTKAPFCSDQMKGKAVRAYARLIGWKGYYTAIGIRNDELDRIGENYKEERLVYPLIKYFPCDKSYILNWWKGQGFDLKGSRR